jgi:hypothetical protein
MYFRNPRRLLVLTGPPFSRDKDPELARLVNTFDGRKVVCGGTTANILGRLLKRDIAMDLDFFDPEVPPTSRMKGVDLITEGTITLAKVASLLEDGVNPDTLARNAVRQLVSLLLDSDIVQFVVGTRINEAHQDPSIPAELDLRRNIIKRIARQLEQKHFQETSIRYL